MRLSLLIAITLSYLFLASGCTTYSTESLSRSPSDQLSYDNDRPLKGVPIALKVPTHVDIFIEESYFIGRNDSDQVLELTMRDRLGNPIRSLNVRPEMVHTKKIFVVDFKRAAAGATKNGLEFNADQYLSEVSGKIEDETITQAAEAFSAIAPLLKATPTNAKGEDVRLTGSNIVSGKRVVAFRRFDIAQVDFEDAVSQFVEQHISSQ